MATDEEDGAAVPAGGGTAVHDAQRALLAGALRQSEEELENVERCFRVWTARQRMVIASMAARQKEPSALAHDVDRLRGGNSIAKVANVVTLDSKHPALTVIDFCQGKSSKPCCELSVRFRRGWTTRSCRCRQRPTTHS